MLLDRRHVHLMRHVVVGLGVHVLETGPEVVRALTLIRKASTEVDRVLQPSEVHRRVETGHTDGVVADRAEVLRTMPVSVVWVAHRSVVVLLHVGHGVLVVSLTVPGPLVNAVEFVTRSLEVTLLIVELLGRSARALLYKVRRASVRRAIGRGCSFEARSLLFADLTLGSQSLNVRIILAAGDACELRVDPLHVCHVLLVGLLRVSVLLFESLNIFLI